MPTTRSRRLRSYHDSEPITRAELAELERARKRLGSSGRRAKVQGKKTTNKDVPTPPDTITASVTFFVATCVAVFLFFENPYLEPFEAYRLVNGAVLLWIPVMAVAFFLKQDIKDFGMTRGDRKFGLKFTGIAILVMLPLLVIASVQPNFRAYYGQSLAQPLALVGYAVREGWQPPVRPIGLLYYEMGQGFYLFCWEFFFRGFMLFGLSRARFLGPTGGVLIQAVAFAALHWSIVPAAAKPPLEIASALLGGIALGWLAARTKSFVYGFVIHWSISAILDILLICSMLAHVR